MFKVWPYVSETPHLILENMQKIWFYVRHCAKENEDP